MNVPLEWIGPPLDGEKNVHKYLSLHRAIQLFESRTLSLGSPSRWWDPVEEYWATQKYAEQEAITKKSAFGSCWTVGPKNDALWQIYSKEAPAIRIRSRMQALQGQLKQCGLLSKGKLYFGRTEYLSDSKLRERARALQQKTQAKDVGRNLAAGLMLKREAFDFEQELRILWICAGRSKHDRVDVPVLPVDFIDQIRIDPRLDPRAAEAIAAVFTRSYQIKDCKQSSLNQPF